MRNLVVGLLALALASLCLAASGCGGSAPPATESGADEADAGEQGEEEVAWCCCNVCRDEFFARKGGDTSGEFLGCLVSESWETEADCEAFGRGCIEKSQSDCSGY